MNDKDNIDKMLQSCCAGISPVLKEYLLLPSNAFFRLNIKYTAHYYDEKKADKYRGYVDRIKAAFTNVSEEERDVPILMDIIKNGLKKRDERLSEAILYSVFVYPMEILKRRENKK